jgi:hypothetical protein
MQHFGHNKHSFRRAPYISTTVIWNVFAFGRFLGDFWIHIGVREKEFLNGIANKK